jgi:HPt (histidine-containing phosphotransfer) domain-containing protein
MPVPAFNLDYLKEIFGNNYQSVAEVIGLFLEELPTAKETLDNTIVRKDKTATRKAAHKIKSSLRAIGANELADIAADIENLSEDNWDKIPELLKSFQNKLPELENQLRLYLLKNK